MEYDFDPAKAEANLAKHGVDFADAGLFDWDSALVRRDTRRHYGEDRFVALGLIAARLHVLVFTTRGDRVRIIGLRRANRRERAAYDRRKR
jgi:hypothetical protein